MTESYNHAIFFCNASVWSRSICGMDYILSRTKVFASCLALMGRSCIFDWFLSYLIMFLRVGGFGIVGSLAWLDLI